MAAMEEARPDPDVNDVAYDGLANDRTLADPLTPTPPIVRRRSRILAQR
jgi:hypothetical protein